MWWTVPMVADTCRSPRIQDQPALNGVVVKLPREDFEFDGLPAKYRYTVPPVVHRRLFLLCFSMKFRQETVECARDNVSELGRQSKVRLDSGKLGVVGHNINTSRHDSWPPHSSPASLGHFIAGSVIQHRLAGRINSQERGSWRG